MMFGNRPLDELFGGNPLDSLFGRTKTISVTRQCVESIIPGWHLYEVVTVDEFENINDDFVLSETKERAVWRALRKISEEEAGQ